MAVDHAVIAACPAGVLAHAPVLYGSLSSLAACLAVSLMTRPADAAVLAAWRERLAGRPLELASEPAPARQ
ncbi:hypothetical protein [Streptomyces viridochromogenes]|uniref:Putative Sodium:solute symporter family protein n=1 Tax=Streptomyces viridochromogenes Tue57 TaxID=1160705 RepID=L8P705_STRVR|nr:putative Sodium:solute symporter family protein [Streptomyces viridochromogenes Tue57]